MRKLAKSDKGSYCNQGKWINEPEYRKGYYDEYYNDDFDLIATDKGSSSYSGAESHNVSAPQEKNILSSSENLSTLAISLTFK